MEPPFSLRSPGSAAWFFAFSVLFVMMTPMAVRATPVVHESASFDVCKVYGSAL
jgi:hypothetical protein